MLAQRHTAAALQVWEWGGVALYSMLSALNALWFVRICSMILKGLQKREAPRSGTLANNGTALKQIGCDETAQVLAVGYAIKGATDASQMRKRK